MLVVAAPDVKLFRYCSRRTPEYFILFVRTLHLPRSKVGRIVYPGEGHGFCPVSVHLADVIGTQLNCMRIAPVQLPLLGNEAPPTSRDSSEVASAQWKRLAQLVFEQ